jgi:DNA polymerase
VPSDDALEEDWRTYYASIFNPARLKVSAMLEEMPKKYWRNLPEAELIPQLIRHAPEARVRMLEKEASMPPVRHVKQAERAIAEAKGPEDDSGIATLEQARQAVDLCRRCPLYENATQGVFGEGPATADVMFVGEQPGDQEDLAGQPFIGPAGQLLNQSLDKVGINRSRVFVTNAVKHFKFEPRGKRRIHQKPNAGEIAACRFWLGLERELVRPKLIVALGATAAQSLLGRAEAVSKLRGRVMPLEDGSQLFVTVHPSYLLRIPNPEAKLLERERFEDDLRQVLGLMPELGH